MEIIISFVWHNWDTIIQSISTIISACAAIAALTPTPTDDKVLSGLRKVINFLGMNWGHAKNGK